MKSTLFVCLLVIPALTVLSTAQGQQDLSSKNNHHRYKLIDLGTLGGNNASVNGIEAIRDINQRNMVAGAADTAAADPFCFIDCFVNHAFRWNKGVLADLGALPGDGNNSYALWITDDGRAVGISENGTIDPDTGTPAYHAVSWGRGGTIKDLGTLGGTLSLASSANERGMVVGGAFNSVADPWSQGPSSFETNFFFLPGTTQAHAFLWQRGTMMDLGTLGGPDSVAAVINNRGQVAGTSFTNSTPNPTTGIPTAHPFFWDGGAMQDLGTFGGTNSLAMNMNNHGQVVGWANVEGDESHHAFSWKQGLLKDLGTKGGGPNSQARAVNDAGEIVGSTDFSADSTDHHAFFWKNGVMTDLGAPAGQPCSTAYSINSAGAVVGDSGVCGVGGVGWLWEKGSPIVALQSLVSPPSEIIVTGAVSINDRGVIVAGGILPNGDQHVILLVPREADESDATDESAASAFTPASGTRGEISQPTAEPGRRRR